MQISRNWRLNAQRYRLQGFRHRDGQLSLQQRPQIIQAPIRPTPALPQPARA